MTSVQYRLDQQQSGLITIGTTPWQFWVITLSSLPDNTPITHTIVFGNTTSPGDLLRRTIPGSTSVVSEADLIELAKAADARDVPRGTERVTIRPASPYDHNNMWLVVEPSGTIWRNSHAVEKLIGELSPDDIARIVTR